MPKLLYTGPIWSLPTSTIFCSWAFLTCCKLPMIETFPLAMPTFEMGTPTFEMDTPTFWNGHSHFLEWAFPLFGMGTPTFWNADPAYLQMNYFSSHSSNIMSSAKPAWINQSSSLGLEKASVMDWQKQTKDPHKICLTDKTMATQKLGVHTRSQPKWVTKPLEVLQNAVG